MEKTLGQVAYEAYAEERGWRAFGGDKIPPWADSPPWLKSAWENAAVAVLREADRRIREENDVNHY